MASVAHKILHFTDSSSITVYLTNHRAISPVAELKTKKIIETVANFFETRDLKMCDLRDSVEACLFNLNGKLQINQKLIDDYSRIFVIALKDCAKIA